MLQGIGMAGGPKLVNEVFYREFDNRRHMRFFLKA
jgi:hypothetical protein